MTNPDSITVEELREVIIKAGGGRFGDARSIDLANAIFLFLRSRGRGEVGEWRPIETAPRDGSHIIVAFGQDTVAEGWWDDGDDIEPHPWKFVDTGGPMPPGGRPSLGFINGGRDDKYGPTHWRPLPAAPGSASADVEPEQPGEDPLAIIERACAMYPGKTAETALGLYFRERDWAERKADAEGDLEVGAGFEFVTATQPKAVDAEGNASSLIGARMAAADQTLIDCPVCSAVDAYRTEMRAEAYHVGAMAALGCEWWDDASDFFALVGQDYAAGKPLPATMPKRSVKPDVEAVGRLKEFALALRDRSYIGPYSKQREQYASDLDAILSALTPPSEGEVKS